MLEQQIDFTEVIEGTDWGRYTGPAAAIQRRGERRRRRLQGGAVAGTALAVVGVAVLVGGGSVTKQSAPIAPAASGTPTTSATRPNSDPTGEKPAIPKPGAAPIESGVIATGALGQHSWQFAYEVLPNNSAGQGEDPLVTAFDLTVDGTKVSSNYTQGKHLDTGGYADQSQFTQGSLVIASGTPSPDVTSVDLRWKDGRVVPVPIVTALGTRIAAFAWDAADPPNAVEQVHPGGVQSIKITRAGTPNWTSAAGTPETPVKDTKPPVVDSLQRGSLGKGTAAGHTWETTYKVAADGSEVCYTVVIDGKPSSGPGCTRDVGPNPGLFRFSHDARDVVPFVLNNVTADPGTSAIGFEWADGTKTATPTTQIFGQPVAALAFDPANGPAYVLEIGSYGEYRIPLAATTQYTWVFDWS